MSSCGRGEGKYGYKNPAVVVAALWEGRKDEKKENEAL
jgi:hypothetical protein